MHTHYWLSLSLDALDRISPEPSWRIDEYVLAACLLEASSPKVGNVHPTARFDDMDYEDFRRSACVIGDVFQQDEKSSCGRLVFSAIQATREQVGKNTNLGIVLLLSPLVVALTRCSSKSGASFCARWRGSVEATLDSLTAEDSDQIYRAISVAKPGGLGQVEQMDVHQSAPPDLMAAMRVAAAWDDIAKQYATGFFDVFALSERLDFYRRAKRCGWFDSICIVHVERLASHGDTLIARKNGDVLIEDVKRLACLAIERCSRKGTDWKRCAEWIQLDDFLRADGHRRNPGTTADLLAAAVFVSLLREYNTLSGK